MEFEKPLDRCVPAKSLKRAYTPKEARVLARGLPPGWVLAGDARSLSKDFRFREFRDAIRLVNVVADLADAEQHYPELHVGANSLRVVLFTPHVSGVTQNDFVMAQKIAHIGKVGRKLV